MSTHGAIIVELTSNSDRTKFFDRLVSSIYKFPKTISYCEVPSQLMPILLATIVEVIFICIDGKLFVRGLVIYAAGRKICTEYYEIYENIN